MQFEEPAPAKINLALHVRGKLADGRHAIETVFAFCTDGDRLAASPSDDLSLTIQGQFAAELGDGDDNLVLRAAKALRDRAGVRCGAELVLTKNLPVASGVGGGSADAAAALRLLTRLWNVDPAHASAIAPGLGSDVPACLLSLPARGQGAGDQLTVIDLGELSGTAVLLLNPRVQLSTAEVFANWSGEASGPLGDWRDAGNDLRGAGDEARSADRRGARLAFGTARCDVCADVGQRSNLLRLVREQGSAGQFRNGGPAGMVAAGDLSALSGHRDD